MKENTRLGVLFKDERI